MKLLHSFICIIPLVSAGSFSSRKPIETDDVNAQTLGEIQDLGNLLDSNDSLEIMSMGQKSDESYQIRSIEGKNQASATILNLDKCINTDSISIDDQIQKQNSILKLTPSFGYYDASINSSFGNYDLNESFGYCNNIKQSLTGTDISNLTKITKLEEKISKLEIAYAGCKNDNTTLQMNCNTLEKEASYYKSLMELHLKNNQIETINDKTAHKILDLEKEEMLIKNAEMKKQIQYFQTTLHALKSDYQQIEKEKNELYLQKHNVLNQIQNYEEKLGNNIINTLENENLIKANMDLEEMCELYSKALQKKEDDLQMLELKMTQICNTLYVVEEENNILLSEQKKALDDLKIKVMNEKVKKEKEDNLLYHEKITNSSSMF